MNVMNGLKQSHWIWYIFPQLKCFGHSYNSGYYGIISLDEAKAYYDHPVLGSRLIEITEALLIEKTLIIFMASLAVYFLFVYFCQQNNRRLMNLCLLLE